MSDGGPVVDDEVVWQGFGVKRGDHKYVVGKVNVVQCFVKLLWMMAPTRRITCA